MAAKKKGKPEKKAAAKKAKPAAKKATPAKKTKAAPALSRREKLVSLHFRTSAGSGDFRWS